MGWEDSGALFQFLLWNLVQGGQEHGCRMDREWRRWGGRLGWDGDIGECGEEEVGRGINHGHGSYNHHHCYSPAISLEIHVKLVAVAILSQLIAYQ